MLKHTPEGSDEHTSLQDALNKITAMNQHCNEVVRPIQDRRTLNEIYQTLDLTRLANEARMHRTDEMM